MTGRSGPTVPEARRRAARDHAPREARAAALAELLDARFGIPGTRWRFGIDALIGLIPGVGDVVTVAIAAFIIRDAVRLGCSKRTIARMLMNVGIDALAGAVPIVGDVFDVAYKANLKNLKLMREDLASRRG